MQLDCAGQANRTTLEEAMSSWRVVRDGQWGDIIRVTWSNTLSWNIAQAGNLCRSFMLGDIAACSDYHRRADGRLAEPEPFRPGCNIPRPSTPNAEGEKP